MSLAEVCGKLGSSGRNQAVMLGDSLSRRAFAGAGAASLLSVATPSELLAVAPPKPSRPFLVTGSSSGIGRAAAHTLSSQSRFVLCAARSAAGAQDAASAASRAGYGLALPAGLEQSDLESVRSYIRCLDQEWPAGVEGALLCAGVEALPLRRTPQDFEATFAVNTLSHFLIAVELAARAVQHRRGS